MWCSRSIYSEDRDDFADVEGKRTKIGSKVLWRPSLEWFQEYARDLKDTVRPIAREWWLYIAAISTAAPEEEERRQDAISANLARHEAHWRQEAESRQAVADGG